MPACKGVLGVLSFCTALSILLPVSIARADTCYTKCIGLVQFECGTNKLFGMCVGAWGCPTGYTLGEIRAEGQGAHECINDAGRAPGTDTGSPTGNPACKKETERQDCPAGYRCATPVVGKNECVKTCDRDRDCPDGQKCKQPIGTGFKRCK